MGNRFIGAMVALAVAGGTVGAAWADLTVKDATATVRIIKGFICETSKLCNATVLIKSDGTEIGTNASPVRMDPTGTTTQPVSAASWPLPSGAATQATLAALSAQFPAALGAGGGLKVDGSGTALPVSGTFWQATQPVSAASLPLPSGAATSANQSSSLTLYGAVTETAPASDTASSGLNGRLQRVAQRLTSLIALLPTSLGAGGGLKVDGSGTALPVSAASLPLPTGAATAANQATANTSLGGVSDSAWSGTGDGSIVGLLKGIYGAANGSITISGSITNPVSTLTLPSATTAYTAGQLIANSGTAGSVVNPSFAIATSGGAAAISRVRLSTNDATSTAWGAQTIQVDLWTTTPTWTNGDRAAWSPATGAGAHVGSYTCVMSAEYGDGAYAECGINSGNFAGVKLSSGTSVFWSLKAISGSGVTGASKVFTLTPELMN